MEIAICIDGSYILPNPIIGIVRVSVLLWPFEFAGVRVSQIFPIFFEPYEINTLIVTHLLAEQHRNIHFRVVGEHYLFLNEPTDKRTSADVHVREVHLENPEKIFNAGFVILYYRWAHFQMSILL